MNKNKSFSILLLFGVLLVTTYQNCSQMASDEYQGLSSALSDGGPQDVAAPPDSLGLNRFVFDVRVENITRVGQSSYAGNDVMRVTVEASSDTYGCGDLSTGTACNQYSAGNVGNFRPLVQNYIGLEGFQCSRPNVHNVVRCVRDDRPAVLYPPGQYKLAYTTIVPATAEVLRTSSSFSIVQVLPTPTPTPTPIVTPPPSQPPTTGVCPSSWAGQPWANYVRRTDQTRFTHLRRLTGGNIADFPTSGGLGLFHSGANEYISIQFEAVSRLDLNGDGRVDIQDFNSILKVMTWIEAQGGGYEADLSKIYLSISQCPGDFRMPTSYQAPPGDPTLSFGCRNIIKDPGGTLAIGGALAYQINQPASENGCGLTYGGPYYLNFMVVNPLDGYQPNERNCNFPPGEVMPSNARCGVQMSIN